MASAKMRKKREAICNSTLNSKDVTSPVSEKSFPAVHGWKMTAVIKSARGSSHLTDFVVVGIGSLNVVWKSWLYGWYGGIV